MCALYLPSRDDLRVLKHQMSFQKHETVRRPQVLAVHPPGLKNRIPKLTAGKEQHSLPSHVGVESGPPAGRKHGGHSGDLKEAASTATTLPNPPAQPELPPHGGWHGSVWCLCSARHNTHLMPPCTLKTVKGYFPVNLKRTLLIKKKYSEERWLSLVWGVGEQAPS